MAPLDTQAGNGLPPFSYTEHVIVTMHVSRQRGDTLMIQSIVPQVVMQQCVASRQC